MSLSPASINTAVFDALASAMDNVVFALTVSTDARVAYYPTTGTYGETTTSGTGRVMAASKSPNKDIFPENVIGPADTVVITDGLTIAPRETDIATFDGADHVIKAVRKFDAGFYGMLVT